MEVIVLEEEAFYELYNRLVADIKKQLGVKSRDKWIDDEEAMSMLKIKSKTTLQKFRNEGKIRYSEVGPRLFLYDSDSIDAYIEKNAKNPF
ncbi:helix-turn-helix domain-containing protein [Taibaiella koreensis]|uniref:helix-turn-helix domain-containing protein n=1 Tax=Taibaiella koreensis TaxID=1268548 RepID=UPI000E5A0A0E|nr:helix-turn-helix domain-containing protein [Taibaiella koreensis]